MRVGLAIAIVVVGLVSDSAAQHSTLGPRGCIACHDHSRQALKWQKEEPAALGGRAHFNTRKQLDGPKAEGFAKAIGLADTYDPKGSCVQCHATVVNNRINAGVSCESCHGPASAYNVPHQTKGAYAQAVALGLRDLRGKPDAIAASCVECHVTPDKRLAAAGHPNGATFDAGASLRKIVHWNAAYDFAAITATGRRLTTARIGRGGAAGAPAPAPPKPPVPAPGGQAAPPAPATKPPAAAAAPGGTAPSTAPAATPPPWDWDQVQPLPSDYGTGAATDAPADPAAEATQAPAATRAPRRPKVEVPATLSYESPLPPPVPGGIDTGPLAAAVAPAATTTEAGEPVSAPAAPASPASRAASLLERALRGGAKDANLPPASKPQEFAGPDGELLRLEDEALALAIEALRRRQ